MNQLFGYTFGTVVLLFFLALVAASILIAFLGKGIWSADKEEER